MAGLELLFTVAKGSFQGKKDAVVCCLHWCMVSNGFRCVGTGQQVSEHRDDSDRGLNRETSAQRRCVQTKTAASCWMVLFRCRQRTAEKRVPCVCLCVCVCVCLSVCLSVTHTHTHTHTHSRGHTREATRFCTSAELRVSPAGDWDTRQNGAVA